MKDLLTRALDAHGGLSRWREIEAFQLKVSIGGGLWRLKGLPDGLRDVTLRIQAHRPIVTITPFGGEARTGHFTPDRVWIEDANGGVVEERATPRASFAGHVLTTPWDKLQELYFVSYALWNYLATPFVFTEPGFETREIGPHEENGETWHRLLVKYPSIQHEYFANISDGFWPCSWLSHVCRNVRSNNNKRRSKAYEHSRSSSPTSQCGFHPAL
jgi:hypothetical protein